MSIRLIFVKTEVKASAEKEEKIKKGEKPSDIITFKLTQHPPKVWLLQLG